MDNELDDTIKEFLIECNENLDQLDIDLLRLEETPDSHEILDGVFRTLHTIKGSAGFLAFSQLEAVSHAGENLLSLLREDKLSLNSAMVSGLLKMVDAIRLLLSNIDKTNEEGTHNFEALIHELESFQPTEKTPAPKKDLKKGTVKEEASSDLKAAKTQEDIEVDLSIVETNIRVDISLVDKLMDLVGELVLARNQILQFRSNQEDSAFLSASQSLNLVTSELQEAVMKTRLQTIDKVWGRIPRMLRDLTSQNGKKIKLVMEGRKTELDRTIIEAIKDPLVHIIRNSIDHGIEKPALRKERGKPAEGTIRLRAYHEGGQVNIEIWDDGGGIDPEKIKAKALEQRFITPEAALHMSDSEALKLIFRSSLSTAAEITNISGRGVGMDVVKTNIEKIGGIIDLNSQLEKFTSLKIKIPLTLAIVPALMVTSQGYRYAIPQSNLVEMVRLAGEQAKKGIEMVHGAPVYRLRGLLLPIVFLREVLNPVSNIENAGKNALRDMDILNIVVLKAGIRQFGLIVDEVSNTQEIVVKSLGKKLKGIPIYAGATVMGDGKVALILDVISVAHYASVTTKDTEDKMKAREDKAVDPKVDNLQTLLLFHGPDKARMAIPLANVARLEKFDTSRIEKAGDYDFIQYRGEILPMIYLNKILNSPNKKKKKKAAEKNKTGKEKAKKKSVKVEESVQMVVVNPKKGKNFGIVVENIIDIVEDTLSVKGPATRGGVLFSVVIHKHVTEILDFQSITEKVESEFILTKEMVGSPA